MVRGGGLNTYGMPTYEFYFVINFTNHVDISCPSIIIGYIFLDS